MQPGTISSNKDLGTTVTSYKPIASWMSICGRLLHTIARSVFVFSFITTFVTKLYRSELVFWSDEKGLVKVLIASVNLFMLLSSCVKTAEFSSWWCAKKNSYMSHTKYIYTYSAFIFFSFKCYTYRINMHYNESTLLSWMICSPLACFAIQPRFHVCGDVTLQSGTNRCRWASLAW